MGVEGDDPRVGTILAERYRIDEQLSSGAMGAVYRGELVGLGRVVAIKFLHPHFAEHPDFTRRFEREAQTMSRLNHPNCVSVLDYGVDHGSGESPYIVMDYVSGQTLRDLVDQGSLEVERAVGIGSQVLAGLAHAHREGIIHRDVKPANIMLSSAEGAGDHVRILDFGLAKLRDSDQSMAGVVVGTPSYMSPEQASYKKLDARSDIYAAGVVVFELLTGDKPFVAEEAFDIIRLHLEAPPPALVDRRPGAGFSEALEAAVAKALAKSPEDRYPSALAFASALEGALEDTGGGARARSGPARREAERAARTRGRLAAGSDEIRGASSGDVAAAETVLAPAQPARDGPAESALAADANGAALPADVRGEVGEARSDAPAGAKEGAPATPRALSIGPARSARSLRGLRRSRGLRRIAGLGVAAGAAAWILAGAPGLPEAWKERAAAGAGAFVDRVRGVAGEGGESGGGDGRRVTSVERAEELAAEGEVQEALRGLHELRRQRPEDDSILYAMGELYFQRGWYAEGLAALEQAVETEGDLGDRSEVIERALEAHDREDTRDDARALLVRIGGEALPAMREAADSAEDEGRYQDLREAIEEIERRAEVGE